jgi:diaminopimelate decarboxylase
MEEFQFKDNRLYCEQVFVNDVAASYGTPVYIYSKSSILDHSRHIERAFGETDHLSCYAVKANANRNVLRILAGEGIGADVGSLGELHLAVNAGFPPSKITYSGVGKRDDEIEYALQKDILSFNVESEEEIVVLQSIAKRLGKIARILLRVNFDIDAGTHPYVTTGSKHNKFGVESSRAVEILLKAKSLPGIEVMGIHSHIGSQITDSTAFIAVSKAAVDLVSKLRDAGIPIKHLNIGGGFGVQYYGYISHPLLPLDVKEGERGLTTVKILKDMLPVLSSSKCTVVIQPGRSILAHAGILLTKVLYRKQNGGKTFVIVDAGMNDLIRPSLYKSYHQIVPVTLNGAAYETVDVVGPLCESGDFLAQDRIIPKVDRGDYLAVMCTGAYGYTLSSNYNARPRPAEVLVTGNAFELIRSRELLEQL